MTRDRDRIDFQERVEERQKDVLERLRGIERRCDEEAEARRREWEAAKGREMNRAERLEAGHDALLIKMNVTTLAHVAALNDIGEDLRNARERSEKKWEESGEEARAEARAGREALLRMLDRLPPRDGE